MTESQHREYKQSWRDDHLKWISGFANAEGGILVIGRNDAGQVVELKNAAKLLEDIPNKVRDILGIFVACKAADSPEPKIHFETNELYIEFPYSKKYLRTLNGTPSPDNGVDEKLGRKLGGKLGRKLGRNRQKIVELMQANPSITAEAISEHLGISQTAVENNIRYLKEADHIRRVGPTKGGRWEVLK